MPLSRIDICIDCRNADTLEEFWIEALGYRRYGSAGQYRSIVPDGDAVGPKLLFQQVDDEFATTKNRIHLDLVVGDAMAADVDRLVALGATKVAGPITEAGTTWTVMTDPEGNEFCLCVT